MLLILPSLIPTLSKLPLSYLKKSFSLKSLAQHWKNTSASRKLTKHYSSKVPCKFFVYNQTSNVNFIHMCYIELSPVYISFWNGMMISSRIHFGERVSFCCCCCFLFFYSQVVFHRVYIPQFLHPDINQGTSGLVPYCRYCHVTCYEHGNTYSSSIRGFL